jgi:enoyl-CoA hydratase
VLHTTVDGNVTTVRLDHGRANALDTELCTTLAATVRSLDADDAVHAIVLTGTEGVFCAGVDLRVLDGAEDTVVSGFLTALDESFQALLLSDTPVVAAVTGHAIAGGAILAAAADRVVAADDDRIRLGLTELRVGVPFPTSAFEIVRSRCPAAVRELVWLAELMSPAQAQELGLVDEVVPATELTARVADVAARLASPPAVTRSITRAQVWADGRERLAGRRPGWEPQVVAAWCAPEVREHLGRFVRDTLG